jgi:hypothetical protein
MTECPVCGGAISAGEQACQFCGAVPDWLVKDTNSSVKESAGGQVSESYRSVTSEILKLGLAVVSPAIALSRVALMDLALMMHGQDAEVPIANALLLTAETAFSRLSPAAKNRWFEWLVPVARLDRIVDETVLGTIYLRFSAACSNAQDRERFVRSMFEPQALSEPAGEPDLGGEFLRWLLLWDALTIAGLDPSEKAQRYISKLARRFELAKPWRQRLGERAKRVRWGEKIESAGDKLSENPVSGPLGAGVKILGGWVSDFLGHPADDDEAISRVNRLDVQNLVEASLSESPVFRAEVERIAASPKDAANRLTEINARLADYLREDAESFERLTSSEASADRSSLVEALRVIRKVLQLGPVSDAHGES